MDPIKYVKKFRIIAIISWFGFMLAAIILMLLSVLPRSPLIPGIALIAGAIPVLGFKVFNTVRCPRCHHKMKIFSSFPHTIYKCTKCSHIVNTSVERGKLT